ncbi:MAG: FAD-binding protein [Proteobacteria bacterium]|nr:FAD-binding protein [Pseudomonadota bacterium]
MAQSRGEASWSNWSGSVSCRPVRAEQPGSEAALADLVRRARDEKLSVRVAGTGHSFMPLVASDGVVVLPGGLQGIESHDRDRLQVWVRSGTVLHDLGDPLLELGMAMANLGDIDVQTLGGALATGTHGTGRTLGNLSSRVVAIRFVNAEGEVVTCSGEDDPELLRALRVSVGAVGAVSAACLQLVPAYKLHERIVRASTDECLEALESETRRHRHFEFFWYPHVDRVEMKSLDLTDEEPDDLPDRKGERIGWSPHIIPSVRELKFNEMEYAVPEEHGPACFAAVRERIRTVHPDVVWPVEYRTLASDDALLSTAHGRPTVTISVHQDGSLPFRDFFADVEPIFWDCGGRPHWGKVHTRTARDLRQVYPRWEDFQTLREQHDPQGRFLNDHLRTLFLD